MSAFSDFYAKQIETDLDWRERELAVLRKQLLSTEVGSSQETTYLRTNLAMLYAHYEGFCKFALGVYIDALESLSLKRSELKWVIAAQSLGKFQMELKAVTNSGEYFSKLLNELGMHLDAKASYEKPEAVGNLWPDLLMGWLSRLGLDSTNVQGEKNRLDRLVSSRNQIAHGRKLTVANRGELDKHVQAATLAMHEVAVGITDALEKKLYARSASVMTILPHAVP